MDKVMSEELPVLVFLNRMVGRSVLLDGASACQ